jgi:hypothetical protein
MVSFIDSKCWRICWCCCFECLLFFSFSACGSFHVVSQSARGGVFCFCSCCGFVSRCGPPAGDVKEVHFALSTFFFDFFHQPLSTPSRLHEETEEIKERYISTHAVSRVPLSSLWALVNNLLYLRSLAEEWFCLCNSPGMTQNRPCYWVVRVKCLVQFETDHPHPLYRPPAATLATISCGVCHSYFPLLKLLSPCTCFLLSLFHTYARARSRFPSSPLMDFRKKKKPACSHCNSITTVAV